MSDIVDVLRSYLLADGGDLADVEKAMHEIVRLRAECDIFRADAARYRWLRDIGDSTWVPLGKRKAQFTHEIDAAIDAAIKETENE
jgi:hypothetical protein